MAVGRQRVRLDARENALLPCLQTEEWNVEKGRNSLQVSQLSPSQLAGVNAPQFHVRGRWRKISAAGWDDDLPSKRRGSLDDTPSNLHKGPTNLHKLRKENDSSFHSRQRAEVLRRRRN